MAKSEMLRVRVTPELRAILQARALKIGVSESEYVRTILQRGIAR